MSGRPAYRSATISDLHLRAGRGDDFKFDRQFSALIDALLADGCRELVLNGDVFEFVATWPETQDHPDPGLGYTEAESTARLVAIAMEHPEVFEAMRRFCVDGGRLVVLPGNHDWELHWPQVRQQLSEIVGSPGPDKLQFVLNGRPYRPVPGLHIEHGHQLIDDQNIFHHPDSPLMDDPLGGPRRIEQSVGNWLVRCLVNPVERHFPFVNNVRPFMKIEWLDGGHGVRLMAALIEGTWGAFHDQRIPTRVLNLILSTPPFLRLLGPVKTPLNFMRPEHVMPNLAHALNDDSTSSLRAAARRHLQVFGQTRYVIMGHSHEYIDQTHEVNRFFARHGRAYLNPGSWNPCLTVPQEAQALSIDELTRGYDFPYRIDFVLSQGDNRADLEVRLETFETGKVRLAA